MLIHYVIIKEKIKPKSDYPLKTLYPRTFQAAQNHSFITILLLLTGKREKGKLREIMS